MGVLEKVLKEIDDFVFRDPLSPACRRGQETGVAAPIAFGYVFSTDLPDSGPLRRLEFTVKGKLKIQEVCTQTVIFTCIHATFVLPCGVTGRALCLVREGERVGSCWKVDVYTVVT